METADLALYGWAQDDRMDAGLSRTPTPSGIPDRQPDFARTACPRRFAAAAPGENQYVY
jgi:hypothetical protein